VILRFPYLQELLRGMPPPSLPKAATARWRPLVPITIYGPSGGSLAFGRALLDTGADDSIFPITVANALGVTFLPITGHAMIWRGQQFTLRYGQVDLELIDDTGNALRWTAPVAFTGANVRYPLLGVCGCLEFLDARFRGKDRVVELEPNAAFPPAP
jgi:hypothetical protein